MKSAQSTKNLLAILVLFALTANGVFAAQLRIEAPGIVPFGETFFADLHIDPQMDCVNVVEATVTYPVGTLEMIDISRGESILTLWPEEPRVDQGAGTVTFAGGIPGGFCGAVEGPGAASDASGVLRLVFRAIANREGITATRTATIGFGEPTSVLLHDGFGTVAPLTTQGATVAIRETGALPEDAWQQSLAADTFPPEAFTLFVNRDPSIFDNAFYVTFSTTDKQTGIDYYEIRETDEYGYTPGTREAPQWKKVAANEPYRLADQDLQSLVEVRAVDKAGNERIASLSPDDFVPVGSRKGANAGLIAAIGALAVLSAAALFLMAKGHLRRRKVVP